tara:strand:- start:1174 stop:1311 length:138 start_codon:yes stop_codon:yes gene_type:complete
VSGDRALLPVTSLHGQLAGLISRRICVLGKIENVGNIFIDKGLQE